MKQFWLALMMMAAAVTAHADMTVEMAAGKVVVRATAGKLVAWKPTKEGLAVLVEGDGDVNILKLPDGWQGDMLEQAGMYGVFIRGKAPTSWSALQEEGEWLVREGAATQGAASALMLRDGWKINGQGVARKTVDVGGQTWQVGPVSEAQSVAGSVVGLVRKGVQDAEVAADPEPVAAPIKHAKKTVEKPMKVLAVKQVLANIEPASGNAQAAVGPIAGPSGIVSAAAVAGAAGEIPVFAAESLGATPTPAANSEGLSRVYSAGEVRGVYVPGTAVSLTVPSEILEGAQAEMAAPEPALMSEVEDAEPVMVNALFPPREGNYTDQLAGVTKSLSEAASGQAEREARRDLAAFYLAWQRPEEAVGVLELLPRRADRLPSDPLARMYWGVAKLATAQFGEEKAFDQKGALAKHAQMWRAVSLAQKEDFGMALKEWPRERGILPEYPSYLREMAQNAQATALVAVGDKQVARRVVDELVAQYDEGLAPAKLVRLQGLVRLGTVDEQQGLDYLASAAENTTDEGTAYRAKFEFIEALRQRRMVTDAQVKTYLEEIWLEWRGDNLERDVLNVLADLYEKAGEPREALERWQTLVRAFPNVPDLNAITERMTQAFVDVFDPENPKTYDLITYLGLYYDFRELLPTDERGDRVQEQVATMLADNTLWVRAEPILEQQLAYRDLDAAGQARLALLLAESYRRQGKGGEALKMLDKWQKAAEGANQKKNWMLAQGRVLMDLGRYDTARKTVAPLVEENLEARNMTIDADWKLGDWKHAAGLLQQALGAVPADKLAENSEAQLQVFQLAYAYGQLKDGAGLKTLKERYAAGLEKLPELADGVNAVAAGTGISEAQGGGTMAGLTSSLADLNILTAKVKRLRGDVEKVRKDREEYNNKMRYMELLPPPVI